MTRDNHIIFVDFVCAKIKHFLILEHFIILAPRRTDVIIVVDWSGNRVTDQIVEVAQWLGHRIANCKIGSSSPALPTVLRVRDISNLS